MGKCTEVIDARTQNRPSARGISKQLFEIFDGKIASDLNGFIMLPNNFCTILPSKEGLIDLVLAIDQNIIG